MRIPSGSPPSRQRGFLDWVAPIVSLGTSIFGGAKEIESGDIAAARAEANAQNIEAETEEEARRLKIEQTQELGRARSIIGASGVTMKNRTTPATYLEAVEAEHKREYDWLLESGQSRADAARLAGADAEEEATVSGVGTILGGVGKAFGLGSSLGLF